ncbi:MAG: hypothetical protein AAFP84_17235 [Actinomycetota bacterium]
MAHRVRCAAIKPLLVLASLAAASCGSDDAPAASLPATTERSTSPTSAPTVESGWAPVPRDELSDKAVPPCCADTWHGAPSPTLTPPGDSLADGAYFVRSTWPEDLTQALPLELARFEQCALLPDGSCEPNPAGEPYQPDQLGVDGSATRSLELTLDGSLRAVVIGADLADDGGSIESDARVGSGSDLAELAMAVEDAYAAVFGARRAAGDAAATIIADVTNEPTGGFVPVGNDGFVFRTEAAPPLLFQAVFPFDDDAGTAGRGTDVLTIASIDVVDGAITMNVFAGFTS